MEANNNDNNTFVDPFEEQNFFWDNYVNGTNKEMFDRRSAIDRKNLVEVFTTDSGMKWDMYGECKICGLQCRRRCEICPWLFYCGREHQLEDWPVHKKNCKNIYWDDNGVPRAGKDLAAGTEIMVKSTLFISPRYYTPSETLQLTSLDYEQGDGSCFRPCFGCHCLIPPYFNLTCVCSICKFPIHNKACEVSNWHVNECRVLKELCVQDWYDDVGRRRDIMIHLAVLRGVLLKHTSPVVWTAIMSLGSDMYMTAIDLKNSIVNFILDICKVEGVVEEDIDKFLSIFMKHRLNCGMPCGQNKRLATVLCVGGIPFTVVNDHEANVRGGVHSYRMKMNFRTIRPVSKGELLTIGHGRS